MNVLRGMAPRKALSASAFLLALLALVVVSVLRPTGAARASDYTSSNLPDWAVGPFTRAAQNPLLSPQGTGWESRDVLNPGVVVRDGNFQMLYRADGGGPDQIGYATSTDGITFTRSTANPVITNNVLPYESGGVMDPRLYELNGTYYSFIAGYNWSVSPPQTIMETTSTDLVHWSTAVPVVASNYDPAVLTDGNDTPVQINGRYVMYYGDADPAKGRYVAYSTDMIHWSDNTPIDMHFPERYSPWEICVTVTNYQTVQNGPVNNNILMFVAGTLMAQGRWYYGISEVEFSGSDPTQQLGQLTEPVLSPTAAQPNEWEGGPGVPVRTPHTVFMNSILFHNGQWYMYYGAGDTYVALATAPLRATAQPPFSSTSFETAQRYPDWVDQVDNGSGQSGGISNVGGYPGYGLTGPETGMRSEAAHAGSTALMYSGSANGGATDYAYTQVFDTSTHPPAIDANTTLSYWIFPQGSSAGGVSGNNSTCVALDMVFTDGWALRNLGANDQNGNQLHPAHQCGHLAVDQWNHVTSNIGAVAAGKTLARIDLGYDQPGGSGGYRGYIDDITLTGATGPGGPFGGTPPAVPGVVQAENYDTGGQGVGYGVSSVNGSGNGYRSDGVDLESTSDTGGGYNVGWTASGQWFRYTVNVATAGTYTVSLRVAAPSAVSGALHLANSSGTNLTGAVDIPATGGWQNWTTVTAQATLPAGQQMLTLAEDIGGWNINSLQFTTSGGTPTNLATGQPTSESSHNDVYASSNVTDGNQSTYWESTNSVFPQWVQVDLGSSQSVSRVVLQLPASWGARDQTLSLLASTDGTTFTAVKTLATYTFSQSSNNTVTITFPATTQRYWRVTITANTGWPAGQVSEFQVWNQ